MKNRLRGLIFDFTSKHKETLPDWLYWLLIARLPFGLSFFDMSPLTDEDEAIIEELAKSLAYDQSLERAKGILKSMTDDGVI